MARPANCLVRVVMAVSPSGLVRVHAVSWTSPRVRSKLQRRQQIGGIGKCDLLYSAHVHIASQRPRSRCGPAAANQAAKSLMKMHERPLPSGSRHRLAGESQDMLSHSLIIPVQLGLSVRHVCQTWCACRSSGHFFKARLFSYSQQHTGAAVVPVKGL